MDNFDTTNQDSDNVSGESETSVEAELNHTDKMVGIFSEPSNTFESISKFPPRTKDWFLPVLISSIIAVIAFILLMNNSRVKMDFESKISPKIEKQIQKQIDSGKLTQEKAESAREMGTKMAKIITYPSKFFASWFILFISALIYWLIIKFGFKTNATYTGTLVAIGLPFYIIAIQSIFLVIIAYVTGLYLNTPNLAELLGMEVNKFPGILLSFVDIFMIWYFILVSIGLAKINHSSSTTKYYALTFGVWIVLMLIIFAVS